MNSSISGSVLFLDRGANEHRQYTPPTEPTQCICMWKYIQILPLTMRNSRGAIRECFPRYFLYIPWVAAKGYCATLVMLLSFIFGYVVAFFPPFFFFFLRFSCLPLLRLPLAPRKSLAGFKPAAVTGAAPTLGFWGFIAPIRNGCHDISLAWQGGVR